MAYVVVVMELLLFGLPAGAADIGIGAGARVNVPLKSMEELRDQNCILLCSNVSSCHLPVRIKYIVPLFKKIL